MNSKTLSVVLAICISVLVISVVVRTELFVMESLLPLYEGEVVMVDANPL